MSTFRRYVNCDNCTNTGNNYYSNKFQAGLCDSCLGLSTRRQRLIKGFKGSASLIEMINFKFEKIFGGGEKMKPVKFVGDYSNVSKQLDLAREELARRSGEALNMLKQAHQNKRAALMKAQLVVEAAEIAAKTATDTYNTERVELEKLEVLVDDLSIQKKALYRKAPSVIEETSKE